MYDLSIIIPHYNSPILLEKLLNSIPKKDEIQVIVIDDRSNSNLEEFKVLKEQYSTKNIVFLRNEYEKKGAGTCRNIGLKHAKGEWILFADSDDYFLENLYSVTSKYFNSQYEVIFFKPTSIELDTQKKSDRHLEYENIINNFLKQRDVESEISLRYHFVVPWSKMIKRSFIKKYNIYFDEVIASNDVMFSTKVGYYMQNFHASNDYIYCVTRSKGSLTMNLNKNIYYARLSVFIEYYNFLKKSISKKEFKILKLHGRWLIINAIKYRLKFKEFLHILKTLNKNKIKIFELRLFNPVFYIKRGVYFLYKYKNQKKYFSK